MRKPCACRFLGSVGALNGAKHTANDLDELKQLPAYKNAQGFVHRQAVSDKNVVTANGTAALEFAQEILRALSVAPEDKIKGFFYFQQRKKSQLFSLLKTRFCSDAKNRSTISEFLKKLEVKIVALF